MENCHAVITIILSIMIFCYATASVARMHAASFRDTGRWNIVIYLLVCVMGLRIGANEEVTSNLPGTIGLQSV